MSSIIQVWKHPSSLTRFPSSHSSVSCLRPSPHFTIHSLFAKFGEVESMHKVQVSGVSVVPSIHICIFSILQLESHPSSSSVFPSSHCSVACFLPSPQVGTHNDRSPLGEDPSIHSTQVSIEVSDPPVQP